MPLLRTAASSLLGRHAARRLSRAIPNPVVRTLAITAATALAPIVVNRLADAWRTRRASRAARQRLAHA